MEKKTTLSTLKVASFVTGMDKVTGGAGRTCPVKTVASIPVGGCDPVPTTRFKAS